MALEATQDSRLLVDFGGERWKVVGGPGDFGFGNQPATDADETPPIVNQLVMWADCWEELWAD